MENRLIQKASPSSPSCETKGHAWDPCNCVQEKTLRSKTKEKNLHLFLFSWKFLGPALGWQHAKIMSIHANTSFNPTSPEWIATTVCHPNHSIQSTSSSVCLYYQKISTRMFMAVFSIIDKTWNYPNAHQQKNGQVSYDTLLQGIV